MGYYDEEVKDALEMIKEFGASLTWRQVTEEEPPDLNQPWVKGGPVFTDYTNVHIAIFPVDRWNVKYIKKSKDGNIPEGTEFALMGAQTRFVPRKKDLIVKGDGEIVMVEHFDKLAPNGQIIMYTMQVKR